MKPAKASLLLHPAFIVSLFILLLNDFYWKYAFPNWFTGKLSDFAGMIVLPVFLHVLVPKANRIAIAIFSALFFIWWKSPLSQPLLDFFNLELNIVLHRTIDYSDLTAISILPFVLRLKPWQFGFAPALQKGAIYLLGCTAFFALCATSPLRQLPYSPYTENETVYNKQFCSTKTVEDVLAELRSKGIVVTQETERFYPFNPYYQDLYYRIPQGDTSYKVIPISFKPDSIVYLRRTLYQPNYLIASHKFDDEVLNNIRFQIEAYDSKKKRSCIRVLSFESKRYGYSPDKEDKKRLKGYFLRLFNLPQD